MIEESDKQFVERIGNTPLREIGVSEGARLFALALRGAETQDEIERLRTENEHLTKDAARWRAFISSTRFKMMGSANFDHSAYPEVSIKANRNLDDWLHFGIEVWDKHPVGADEQGRHGRNLLMVYVDHRVKERAALTALGEPTPQPMEKVKG